MARATPTTGSRSPKSRNPKIEAADDRAACDARDPSRDRVTASDVARVGAQVLAHLQQATTLLESIGMSLTEGGRQASAGKLREGESRHLATVLDAAAAHLPSLQGLADKDGGDDPRVFEVDLLRQHLAARDAFATLEPEVTRLTAALARRTADSVLYYGARARVPTLAAYGVLSALAAHDPALTSALAEVRDFYGAPVRKGARTRAAAARADAADDDADDDTPTT